MLRLPCLSVEEEILAVRQAQNFSTEQGRDHTSGAVTLCPELVSKQQEQVPSVSGAITV